MRGKKKHNPKHGGNSPSFFPLFLLFFSWNQPIAAMAPVNPKTLEVFAYDTVKLVRILDRRLGFLGKKN